MQVNLGAASRWDFSKKGESKVCKVSYPSSANEAVWVCLKLYLHGAHSKTTCRWSLLADGQSARSVQGGQRSDLLLLHVFGSELEKTLVRVAEISRHPCPMLSNTVVSSWRHLQLLCYQRQIHTGLYLGKSLVKAGRDVPAGVLYWLVCECICAQVYTNLSSSAQLCVTSPVLLKSGSKSSVPLSATILCA